MGFVEIVVLLAGILAAAISSTLGMAGGVFLLSVMTLFMSLQEAIPLHGFAQLCSNTGRVAHFWKYIQWRITLAFSLLILPGAYLGIRAAAFINKDMLEILVGCLMIWIIHGRSGFITTQMTTKSFIFLGFFSSFIGVMAGATGPMIAPFFMRIGLDKKAMVGTKAICQSLVQCVKLPAFALFAGVQLDQYYQYFVIFIVAAILGSWLGRIMIDRISDFAYEAMIKWSITILAVVQICKATWHYFT